MAVDKEEFSFFTEIVSEGMIGCLIWLKAWLMFLIRASITKTV